MCARGELCIALPLHKIFSSCKRNRNQSLEMPFQETVPVTHTYEYKGEHKCYWKFYETVLTCMTSDSHNDSVATLLFIASVPVTMYCINARFQCCVKNSFVFHSVHVNVLHSFRLFSAPIFAHPCPHFIALSIIKLA